jgi:hypothetical protein
MKKIILIVGILVGIISVLVSIESFSRSDQSGKSNVKTMNPVCANSQEPI